MLDSNALRQQFPAFNHCRNGQKPVYFDGAAGTQVPRQCIAAMTHYLSTCNANTGGVFASSIESDQILHEAHQGMADFVNASSAEEIIFGPNMTTLTLNLSRAIGKILKPGDEIVVTRLDHDANIRPWILAARDGGATVRWVDIHPENCTLDMEDLKRQINENTRLVAVTAASNLVGSKVNVAQVVKWAHEAGAWVFIDAVHYSPHGLIDVQEWNCDFLACSAYKFFGPHLGILWGRREFLEQLPVYKLRPSTESLPGRWMTGTQNHEALAGLTGTLDYLRSLGKTVSEAWKPGPGESENRFLLRAAMNGIQEYESKISTKLLHIFRDRPDFKIWGLTEENHQHQRVPTFAISHKAESAKELACYLANVQIFSWHGNMYAIELTERIGVEQKGGLLRISLVHYNTPEEMDLFASILNGFGKK